MVGAHLSPKKPLEEAASVGADCVQIFLSDPQGWEKPAPRTDAAELRGSKLPLYVHAPYLINVCSPRNNVRYGSRKILQQTCDAAADVGAAAVIVHAGHAEDGIANGVGRWPRTLEMLESEVPVLIENTAGGENAVARRFDALARLWEAVSAADSSVDVGFCFDTCHAHAAGEELSDAVDTCARRSSARSTCCTRTTRATRPAPALTATPTSARDEIGAEVLSEMIVAAGPPVVVETPGGAKDIQADLEFVRSALA